MKSKSMTHSAQNIHGNPPSIADHMKRGPITARAGHKQKSGHQDAPDLVWMKEISLHQSIRQAV